MKVGASQTLSCALAMCVCSLFSGWAAQQTTKLRLGLKSWKLCKTLDIAMQAGLSFLVYSEGYAGVVSDFQGFEATIRLVLRASFLSVVVSTPRPFRCFSVGAFIALILEYYWPWATGARALGRYGLHGVLWRCCGRVLACLCCSRGAAAGLTGRERWAYVVY